MMTGYESRQVSELPPDTIDYTHRAFDAAREMLADVIQCDKDYMHYGLLTI